MARALTAIVTLVDRALRLVIWLLTAAMVAIVVLQVFMRYVLNAALSWPEELTRYFMIWSGLLAAVYAHNEGAACGDRTNIGQNGTQAPPGDSGRLARADCRPVHPDRVAGGQISNRTARSNPRRYGFR